MKMASDPRVSVIIRSYNEERHIGRLLEGLRQQSFGDHEILLVDSGSTDRTVDIARSYGVDVLHMRKEEFSFGRSLNLGCRVARGEFLVFASAHVYPSRKDWLGLLISAFAESKVGLVYGRQRGNHVTRFSEHQIFRKWFPDHDAPQQATYFCNNANCAIRRSLWEQHPYDEILTGLEDLAWAKDAQKRGVQIAYLSEAEIIHVHEESWARIRNRYRREAIALRTIEPTLGFSAFDFLRVLSGNVWSDLVQARRDGVLRREAKSIMLFRFNQFFGTFLGHRITTDVTSEIKDRFYFPVNDRSRRGQDTPAEPSPDGALLIDYERLR